MERSCADLDEEGRRCEAVSQTRGEEEAQDVMYEPWRNEEVKKLEDMPRFKEETLAGQTKRSVGCNKEEDTAKNRLFHCQCWKEI